MTSKDSKKLHEYLYNAFLSLLEHDSPWSLSTLWKQGAWTFFMTSPFVVQGWKKVIRFGTTWGWNENFYFVSELSLEFKYSCRPIKIPLHPYNTLFTLQWDGTIKEERPPDKILDREENSSRDKDIFCCSCWRRVMVSQVSFWEIWWNLFRLIPHF